MEEEDQDDDNMDDNDLRIRMMTIRMTMICHWQQEAKRVWKAGGVIRKRADSRRTELMLGI